MEQLLFGLIIFSFIFKGEWILIFDPFHKLFTLESVLHQHSWQMGLNKIKIRNMEKRVIFLLVWQMREKFWIRIVRERENFPSDDNDEFIFVVQHHLISGFGSHESEWSSWIIEWQILRTNFKDSKWSEALWWWRKADTFWGRNRWCSCITSNGSSDPFKDLNLRTFPFSTSRQPLNLHKLFFLSLHPPHCGTTAKESVRHQRLSVDEMCGISQI